MVLKCLRSGVWSTSTRDDIRSQYTKYFYTSFEILIGSLLQRKKRNRTINFESC